MVALVQLGTVLYLGLMGETSEFHEEISCQVGLSQIDDVRRVMNDFQLACNILGQAVFFDCWESISPPAPKSWCCRRKIFTLLTP